MSIFFVLNNFSIIFEINSLYIRSGRKMDNDKEEKNTNEDAGASVAYGSSISNENSDNDSRR